VALGRHLQLRPILHPVSQREQPLELRRVEPDQVEVEALVPQPGQLVRQQRVVPARL
jgi:hypothetical protein